MKKFQITAGILAVCCLVLIGVFELSRHSIAAKLDTQAVCERWVADGSSYAQLSAFISPQAGFDENAADRTLVTKLDAALVEASISPADEDARIYAYSYSAERDVSLSKLNPDSGAVVKSGVTARAMGVGSDFFIFHRLKLLSGYYFDPTERIPGDLIVIDNTIAWQFFGSPDVVGKELLVNGRRCYITGVVEAEPEYDRFYGDHGRIYMSYTLMKELVGELPITCYEICMPNPIGGFAYDILEKGLGVEEGMYEIVDNSARFSDSSLFDGIKTVSERSVRTTPVIYPYWENAAVILTDSATFLYLLKLIPLVVLVMLIVAEIVIGYVNRGKFYRFVGNRVSRAWDRHDRNKRARARVKAEKKARKQTLKAGSSEAPALTEGKTPEPLIIEDSEVTEPIALDTLAESDENASSEAGK